MFVTKDSIEGMTTGGWRGRAHESWVVFVLILTRSSPDFTRRVGSIIRPLHADPVGPTEADMTEHMLAIGEDEARKLADDNYCSDNLDMQPERQDGGERGMDHSISR